jgi:hypothetical protein
VLVGDDEDGEEKGEYPFVQESGRDGGLGWSKEERRKGEMGHRNGERKRPGGERGRKRREGMAQGEGGLGFLF